jgi:hypothetical protein
VGRVDLFEEGAAAAIPLATAGNGAK